MPQQTINLVIIAIAAIVVVALIPRAVTQVRRGRTIRNINRGVTLRVDPHKEIMAEITECSGPNYDFRKITPKESRSREEDEQPVERQRRGFRTVPGMQPRDAVGRGQ